jgi:hypothetical protein
LVGGGIKTPEGVLVKQLIFMSNQKPLLPLLGEHSVFNSNKVLLGEEVLKKLKLPLPPGWVPTFPEPEVDSAPVVDEVDWNKPLASKVSAVSFSCAEGEPVRSVVETIALTAEDYMNDWFTNIWVHDRMFMSAPVRPGHNLIFENVGRLNPVPSPISNPTPEQEAVWLESASQCLREEIEAS